MKIISFLSALGLLLSGLTACHKEASAPDTAGFFVRADKEDTAWQAPGTGTYAKSQKQFAIIGQAGTAAESTVLSFGFALPARPQLAPVQALPATWSVLVGYDAATNSYATTDSTGLPQIRITRLDTLAKIVEGHFEATLWREKHWTTKPEALHFTNGSFRVRYQEVP